MMIPHVPQNTARSINSCSLYFSIYNQQFNYDFNYSNFTIKNEKKEKKIT